MTKRDTLATLQAKRDEAWQETLAYTQRHEVQAWPEQRDGSLTMHDVELARLRGRVTGLDLAMEALALKRR